MSYSPHPSLALIHKNAYSEEFATGFSDKEEANVRDTAAYMARRDLFTRGLEMERSEQISRKETMRESAERISLNKRVSAWGNSTYGYFEVIQDTMDFFVTSQKVSDKM